MERPLAVQREAEPLVVEVEIAGLSREETCEGPGFSPQVTIGGLSSPHLALIMEDARSHDVYWLLWNVPRREEIPRNLPKDPELGGPISGRQGRNLQGGYGYAPPCPGPGEEGRYVLRVYGLDRMLDLDPATATRDDLVRAMEGHVQQYGEAQLQYSRERKWSSFEY